MGWQKGKRKTEEDSPFGAKVFKISRDSQGNRLTHLKVTSGVLKVKDTAGGKKKRSTRSVFIPGAKFESVKEASCRLYLCSDRPVSIPIRDRELAVNRHQNCLCWNRFLPTASCLPFDSDVT